MCNKQFICEVLINMANKYAVLDITKLHGFGGLRAMEAHNNRDYKMNHIDENLTYLNQEIVPTYGDSYVDRWKNIVSEAEIKAGTTIKPRKGAVYAFDIVTAFSPGAMETNKINIDRWCEANREWMEKTFGAENIIAMTLHMDEVDTLPNHQGIRGPHIHTQIIPIDDRNRLCAKSFIDGRTDLKKLHNSYAKAMSEFDLERGERNSKLKHQSRKKWYNTVAEIVEAKAPRIQDGEVMEDYLARLDKAFEEVAIKAAKAVEKANIQTQRSETRQAQIFGEYAYSVNLQHILEEGYGGDMRQVNERLKQYQLLEKSVPRKNLSVMIDKMLEKYPPENNIAYYRKGKKKKHPKWESIPDTQPVDNNGSSPIMDYEPMLEEENISDYEEIGNVFGETLDSGSVTDNVK